MKFRTFNFRDETGFLNHSAVGATEEKMELGAEGATRVNKETKVLSSNLPCYIAGSIFVVMDENRMDLMKSLISGPVDSPYAHGLFLFDINLPEDYPGQPPNMKLKTTGNGTARFNPNLYADGYICLSILGTWEGSPEEMWIPSQSNILQVLLSIQSLVMDEFVIQKEPGYDYLEKNALENVTYCNIVRYNNIKYAMIDMLRNPPKEFADVIKAHFRIKKAEILKTMEEWLSEAPGFKYQADQQRPEPPPEVINDVDFISNDADPPELHMYESYDSYLYDNLVEDHNWQTLHTFREQGYEQALTEVVNELKIELERLE